MKERKMEGVEDNQRWPIITVSCWVPGCIDNFQIDMEMLRGHSDRDCSGVSENEPRIYKVTCLNRHTNIILFGFDRHWELSKRWEEEKKERGGLVYGKPDLVYEGKRG